jgi:hypothetical protein
MSLDLHRLPVCAHHIEPLLEKRSCRTSQVISIAGLVAVAAAGDL